MNKKQVIKMIESHQYAIRHVFVSYAFTNFKLVKIQNADDLIVSLNFDANATIPNIQPEFESAIKLNPRTAKSVFEYLENNGGLIRLRNKDSYLTNYIFSGKILDCIQ
jgi:hypothetical protein